MKRLSILFFVLLFSSVFSSISFAEEQVNVTATEVAPSPLGGSVYTESSWLWEGNGTNNIGQETGLILTYKFNANNSVSVKQAFYNTLLDTGHFPKGSFDSLSGSFDLLKDSFSLDATYVDFKRKNLWVSEKDNIKVSGGFRFLLPTYRLLDEGLNRSGFVTYLAPSVSIAKDAGKVSLSTNLAFRYYVYQKDNFDYYGYADKNATEATLLLEDYPNSTVRPIWTTTLGYQLTEKLALSGTSYFYVDFRRHPGTSRANATAKFALIPEVSYSATDKLALALGIFVGGNSLGGVPLQAYWVDEPSKLLEASQPYFNVSYNF